MKNLSFAAYSLCRLPEEVSIPSRGGRYFCPRRSVFLPEEISIPSRGGQYSSPGEISIPSRAGQYYRPAFARYWLRRRSREESSHLRGICGWCSASARRRRHRFYVDFPRRSVFLSRRDQYSFPSGSVLPAIRPRTASCAASLRDGGIANIASGRGDNPLRDDHAQVPPPSSVRAYTKTNRCWRGDERRFVLWAGC